MPENTASPDFHAEGWGMARDILTRDACAELASVLGDVPGAGRRGMLDVERVAELARSSALLSHVLPLMPDVAQARPVRAIYFDKSPAENWLVPWHQDLTIAVQERLDTPGFGPWSVKADVPHVQPPMELLEQMVTLRLHLDDADHDNGALRVLPGSHLHGRLTAEQIQALRETLPESLCSAKAGDGLLMRPLILHASARSSAPERRRRILHIEYAAFDLPGGLRWKDA